MTIFVHIPFAAAVPLWFWILLWKIVLIGALILFGGMAVWVTIGGFFDIKRLFRRITESHQRQEE
jgi:hypothetical protein